MVFEEMMQQKYIEETSVEIIVEHRSGAEPKSSDKNKRHQIDVFYLYRIVVELTLS